MSNVPPQKKPAATNNSDAYAAGRRAAVDKYRADKLRENQARLADLQRQYAAAFNPTLKARLRAQIDELGPAPSSPFAPNPAAADYYNRKADALGLPTSSNLLPRTDGQSWHGPMAYESYPPAARPQPGTPATPSPFSPPPPGGIGGLGRFPATPAKKPVAPPVAPPSAGRVSLSDAQLTPLRGTTQTKPLTNSLSSTITPSAPLGLPDTLKPPPKTPFPWQTVASGLGDAVRIGTGIALASKPVPMPTVPPRWLDYQGEVTARKNQGFSPEEMALANNSIANNYRQGVNALTLSTGGGASPGIVLAGLSNLGLQRGQQTQSLFSQDAARRNANFNLFGAVTGQTAGMESAIQQEGIARASARQAAGIGLVQNTLSQRANRNTYQENQPLWDQYNQSQLDQGNEATDTLAAMRKRYQKGTTNQGPFSQG